MRGDPRNLEELQEWPEDYAIWGGKKLPHIPVTLVGVHASELHPSNFHFVDPAAVPAIATTAQMVADLHAHNLL
jgi:hypothetical protein